MARGVPGFVRIGAALAGCALVAACTPEAAPTQTPAPPASVPPPSASPTPSATPTETEIERQQRLDWEAAEKAYRTSVVEVDKLARRGLTKASSPLRQVATGEYLEVQLLGLRGLLTQEGRYVGEVSIVGVARDGGWSQDRLNLLGCEDNSTWKLVDEGRDVTPKEKSDYLQALSVQKVDGLWKVSNVTSTEVANVEPADCSAN